MEGDKSPGYLSALFIAGGNLFKLNRKKEGLQYFETYGEGMKDIFGETSYHYLVNAASMAITLISLHRHREALYILLGIKKGIMTFNNSTQ